MPLSRTARAFRSVWIIVAALACLAQAGGSSRAATYDSPAAIERDFEAGLAALAAGRNDEAIRLFRRILADDPDLPRVRLELARAYFQARDWDRSRREFFAVLSGDIPQQVRANIIRFLRAIDARRGFDWNLSVGLAASPEATRSYDTDTILVDFFGTPLPFEIEREDDGQFGLSIAADAEYRHELPSLGGDAVQVTALGEGFLDLFEGNGGGADDYIIGGAAGLRGAWPQTTVTGKVLVSAREFAGDHLEDRLEFQGTGEYRTLSGLSLFAGGAAGLVDDRVANARDGRTARLRAGIAKSLGGRSIAGIAGIGQRLDAEADHESYTALGAEIFGSTDLGAGLATNASVYVLRRDYDARNPVLVEDRRETEIGFDVEVTKADLFLFNHFSPFVRLGYSRLASSIDAFSYHEYRFEVGLSKSF